MLRSIWFLSGIVLAAFVLRVLTASAIFTIPQTEAAVSSEGGSQGDSISDGGWLQLRPLGQFRHGSLGKSAAEIAAYDVATRRLFVVNVEHCAIDVLELTSTGSMNLVRRCDVGHLGVPTSVTAKSGLIAASVLAASPSERGHVVFLSPEGKLTKTLRVGHCPDMLTITPDGLTLLVANEGEPEDDYSFDPEGSVSLIDISRGIELLADADVRTADFQAFNSQRDTLDPSIRIFGPGATVAQDLEPEYIAVSADSRTAWVALQENNAVAIVDIPRGIITAIKGMGYKNHALPGNGFDPSDRDGGIHIRNWPVQGLFQPDGMCTLQQGGETFVLTANDGKDRDYSAITEECRVADLKLDPRVFPNAEELQRPENLGRLRTSRLVGDHNRDGLHEEIFSYGGRSFSIWTADMQPVFESGDQFETIIAARHPAHFNSNHEKDNFEGRSAAKGPEPEGIITGRIGDRTYAFIGLERMGGVMVYDVSDVRAPRFECYFNPRRFDGTPDDLGPEGLLWIDAGDSPTGECLLVMACEISGTTRVVEVVPRENDIPSLAN